jgi:hypothetical protein
MNINEFIFSRTQPQKKIDTINALSEDELLSTSEATVKRIVKDAGRRMWKTRDKELRISHERRAGNAWNSLIEAVELIKGRLYLEVYLQYENTDTSTSEEYDDFFRNGNYRGEVRRSDRYGNGRTYYFLYNSSDKASVMKSILLEYVFTKYAAKLTQKAA